MIHLSLKDSGSLGVLTLHGRFTERNAEELRAHLARSLGRVSRLIINCEQVAALDLHCLKLLCTAYRVSQVMKKELLLAGDRTSLFHGAVGMDETIRCSGADQQCGTGCLWLDNGPRPYPEKDRAAASGHDRAAA